MLYLRVPHLSPTSDDYFDQLVTALQLDTDSYKYVSINVKGDKYPFPSIPNILDALGECKVYRKLDLTSRYWQIPLHQQHQHKTAFVMHIGLYHFLKTAPGTF